MSVREAALAVATAIAAAAWAGCGHAPATPSPSACPGGVHRGALRLASQESVDALRGCTAVEGDLVVATGAALELAVLSRLDRVSGEVVIGPSLAIGAIELSGLREVGALVLTGNGSATGAFFPALARAGRLEIVDNVALAMVSLPALTRVDGAVQIARNGGLETVDATALVSVGGDWRIVANPLLASLLVAPELVVAGVTDVTEVPAAAQGAP